MTSVTKLLVNSKSPFGIFEVSGIVASESKFTRKTFPSSPFFSSSIFAISIHLLWVSSKYCISSTSNGLLAFPTSKTLIFPLLSIERLSEASEFSET